VRLANSRVRTSLPSEPLPQQHLELLRQVHHNPTFRAQLRDDPAAAFAQLGLVIDPADIPQHVVLPKAAAIEAGAEDLSAASSVRFLPWYPFLTDDSPAN